MLGEVKIKNAVHGNEFMCQVHWHSLDLSMKMFVSFLLIVKFYIQVYYQIKPYKIDLLATESFGVGLNQLDS